VPDKHGNGSFDGRPEHVELFWHPRHGLVGDGQKVMESSDCVCQAIRLFSVVMGEGFTVSAIVISRAALA